MMVSNVYKISHPDGTQVIYRTGGNIQFEGQYTPAQSEVPLSKFQATFEDYFRLLSGASPNPSQVSREV